MKRVFLSFYLFVILILLVLEFGFGPVLDRIVLKFFHQDITQYYRKLTSGVFFVMIEDLQKIDQDHWSDFVTAWQPHFGFPIAVQPIDQLTLSKEDMYQLTAGLIVTVNDGDVFYQRISNSAYVLRLGPFHEIEYPLIIKINVVVWAFIIAFASVLVLIWAFLFWHKLTRIQTAALAFGQGEFNTRAKVPKRSALAPLAEAFNRMADRIQQLIDSHKELTRAVSHELRTPVSRIQFSIEMLAGTHDPANRSSYTDGMRKDVDELNTLISELLTYARFDSESLHLSTQAYPLVAWLNEIVAYIEVDLEGIDFDMHNRISDDLFTARFDPKQMGRAVSNLLRNAATYANHCVELTIERNDDHICLHVDDDGPGIPERARQRIFEPFTRLDDSRSRDSGGHGLGLAIVQRVAVWHGGQASVCDSALGGARFTIRWPSTADTI